MKIQRFEDLEGWKEARNLVHLIYSAINESRNFTKDYRLRDQATGAAVNFFLSQKVLQLKYRAFSMLHSIRRTSISQLLTEYTHKQRKFLGLIVVS